MTRREFVRSSLAIAASAASARAQSSPNSPPTKRWTAAVVGHTGRGNFGHGLDVIFNEHPDVDVLAVADPDPSGRAKAQERARAARAYADYHEMLEREKPQLVSVAPRWTDQHHAMVSAALAVGAHVYCEKPFTRTLAEADDLLGRARRANRKIAVAHQGRLAPATLLLKQRIDDGVIGELLEVRLHGKQDRRAGGEDMLVLGTHQFDLLRYFAGEPLWCNARVLQRGHEITLADAHSATEDIGPVAGDEIEALFALPNGVNAHFTSRARNAATAGPWGMEFVGSKGRARLLNDVRTQVFIAKSSGMSARGETQTWLPLEPAARDAADFEARNKLAPNSWLTSDWLAAIQENREPICSGLAAMKSLEMIHAVWTAGLAGGRVEFPLKNRAHPLVTSANPI